MLPGLVAAMMIGGVFAPPVAAEPCPARAELAGDRMAIERVGTELARLGVERGPAAPGCRGIVAHVELATDGGIAVAIRDGARRSEGRVVGDAAVAASWIDSWLRDDLDGTAWLLATPATARPGSNAPPAATRSASSPGQAAPMLERISLAAAFEQTWLGDGASATGASVAGCLRAGVVCLGVRGRFSREGERDVGLTAMSRGDVSVLATASVPVELGRMKVAPELGVGIGRTTTRRVDGCTAPVMPPNCDPSDPNCAPMPPDPTCLDADGTTRIHVGDNFGAATYTPRLAAAVRLAIPLFDHVWLDGIASVGFGPFGHTGAFTPATDPMSPSNVPGAELALPGESSTAYVLGVGLRLGAP